MGRFLFNEIGTWLFLWKEYGMEKTNYQKVKKVLWVILFANFFVAAVKIIMGQITNSASLTADGFHSLSDGSSNIVGLVGIWFASKPEDEDHPYGHFKFETLCGLLIAGMLAFVSFEIIENAIRRFSEPIAPDVSLLSIGSLIVTLGINIFVAMYEFRAGKKLGSTILVADSMHTRSDIFVSIGVLVTLICIKVFHAPPIVDAVVSFVVAMLIIKAAWDIFRETSGPLLDKAVLKNNAICDIIKEFPEVRDIHRIRNRSIGQGCYVDMHLRVDPQMTVEAAHELNHRIQMKLREKFNDNLEAIIHMEPFYDKEDEHVDD